MRVSVVPAVCHICAAYCPILVTQDGHVVEEASTTVQPADPACEARLQLGDETMLRELRAMAGEDTASVAEFPLMRVPRRPNNVLNSWGRSLTSLGREGITGLPRMGALPVRIEPHCQIQEILT